ncbi:MAG: hemolysin family protein, partial [Gemmatimonadota bacterium]
MIALVWGAALVAVLAALWAGLLALGEEAAVGEARHTLGDAPPVAARAQVPLHRAFHVSRLALLVLGAVAAADAVRWWERPWVTALGSVGVVALLLFILGDALPRAVARVAPELATLAFPLGKRTLPPFAPLLRLLARVDRGLHTLVGATGPAAPAMGDTQRDVLLGVFSLADTTADEVMTPRLDMIGVDLAVGLEDVVERFRTSEHTRLPVFDGTPDNVVGVLYAKDLVPLAMGLPTGPGVVRWQDLVRPASFVPETKTLDAQLRDFQRGPAHLAVVVDEFGGTAGLITREDVLEEIVGEIRDEWDEEEGGAVEPLPDGAYAVRGDAAVEELNEATGAGIPSSPAYETVAGFLIHLAGALPSRGDALRWRDWKFTISETD